MQEQAQVLADSLVATIRRGTADDAVAYRDCVAAVARERKYLVTVDGFSLQETRTFLQTIEARGWPCAVAIARQRTARLDLP